MTDTAPIGVCLAQLPDRDLRRYLAVLADIATAERRAGHYATAVWFTALGAVGESEQRRRMGADINLPDTEEALCVVLRSLDNDQVAALLAQYRELTAVQSSVPSVTSLARLASVCGALLDAELRRRGATCAEASRGTYPPAPRDGWRHDLPARPVDRDGSRTHDRRADQ